jgi:hypothetical protein
MKLSFVLFATTIFAQQNNAFRPSRTLRVSEEVAKVGTTSMTSANWAGAYVGPPAPETSFYAVIGSFIAPDPKPPPSSEGNGPWKGSAWVGIDGIDTHSLFQAGVSWEVTKAPDGTLETSFSAWHEWLPHAISPFKNFFISAGDIITVLCETDNSTTGTCAIQNQNTHYMVSELLLAPSKESALIGGHAEWIVEDFTVNNGLAAFANFEKVEWFDCEAYTMPVGGEAGGDVLFSPGNGSEVILTNGANRVLTSSTMNGKNMTVTYD